MWAFNENMSSWLPPGTVVNFIPESHKWLQTQKLLGKKSLKNETCIFLDICPPRELLLQIHAIAEETVVHDHHKTAMEDCGDLPFCHFDMTRSGAGLSWDIFSGGVKRPFLIDCIEDGDLWRWTVPDSKLVLIVLETIKSDFDLWSKFSRQLETPEGRRQVLEKGRHYDEYRKKVTSMLLAGKIHKLTFKTGHTLPAVNASIFQSGLGHMVTMRPGPAAAVYFTRGKGWSFSLRSEDKGPDVSKIAEAFGGGGHRNASGFRVDRLEDLNPGAAFMSEYSEEELLALEQELDISEVILPFSYKLD